MTSTLIFFTLLCDILKIVYCGSSPLNSFALQVNGQSKAFELGKEREKIPFDNDEATSDNKSLEKRRLFFPGSDFNSDQPDGISMNNEYPLKRRNNQSVTEEERKFSGEIQNFERDHWDNEKDRFSFVEEKGNIQSTTENHSRQPITGVNQIHDWNKSDIFKKSQNEWNEEKNFNLLAKSNSDLTGGSQYFGRAFNGFNSDYSGGQNSNMFGKRISITTLHEPEMRHKNRYSSDYEFDERRFGYHSHSDRDYNHQKNNGLWDPSLRKNEKGVIINFNTECPVPRQFNNQILHKIIFSPKPSLNTRSEVSMYQFPGAGLIPPHQLTPSYFF